jgi:hypothetical protein
MNFMERIKRIFLKSDEEYDQDLLRAYQKLGDEINRTTNYLVAPNIVTRR